MMQKLFEFHSKLAKQGNLESVTRLGVMYERGEGVEKNRKKAIELYQFAVNGGYKPAQEMLSNILANKSNTTKASNALDNIRVPTPKNLSASDAAEAERQKELQQQLEQEQAAAAAAREELEKVLQAKQDEELKQQKLQQEMLSVKQAQEQLALERAKAEAIRREMEKLRKQREQELEDQKLLATKSQEQAVVEEQSPEAATAPAGSSAPEKTSDKPTFSSDPCKTPAARFMSTCN